MEGIRQSAPARDQTEAFINTRIPDISDLPLTQLVDGEQSSTLATPSQLETWMGEASDLDPRYKCTTCDGPDWLAERLGNDSMPKVEEPFFSEFVLKLHGHCNLACRYCYVYEMADQTWRTKDMRMGTAVVEQTALRIAEHARQKNLRQVNIILHGGEPLLVGATALAAACETLRSRIWDYAQPKFSVQTNGVLLRDSAILEVLNTYAVGVGVSLDGDQKANDVNRTYANGRGTYRDVLAGVAALRDRYPHLFNGMLCTINTDSDPLETYEALKSFHPPTIDFLLPHGNWSTPPPERVARFEAMPYADWLLQIYKQWQTEKSHSSTQTPKIRLFEALLPLQSTKVESIGLEPIRLLVIETNGEIEQVDSLKSTYEGAATTGLNVFDNELVQAFDVPGIQARFTGKAALGEACRYCSIVERCGGGYYPHRWHKDMGFKNPSIYCPDLRKLIPLISEGT